MLAGVLGKGWNAAYAARHRRLRRTDPRRRERRRPPRRAAASSAAITSARSGSRVQLRFQAVSEREAARETQVSAATRKSDGEGVQERKPWDAVEPRESAAVAPQSARGSRVSSASVQGAMTGSAQAEESGSRNPLSSRSETRKGA